MVIMFSLNQAALLSLQLLALGQVFAGILRDDLRNKLVARGESINFTCNTSQANITQISWTKGTSFFAHSISENLTFSNLTSDRLRIDLNLPSELNIVNAQHDDEGLYKCIVTGRGGLQTIQWNLTVSEKPKEISSLWNFLYILTSVIGLLLCAIAPAVCLYRKLRARTTNWNPVQDELRLESTGEVVLQPQAGAHERTNNKPRRQYMERLNSIYGFPDLTSYSNES